MKKEQNNPCAHVGEHILLVEGKNDCHVVMGLAKTLNLPQNFGIYNCESREKALKIFNALLLSQSDRPKIMGLVLDADEAVARRWVQVRSKLRNSGVNLPDQPLPEGVVLPGQGEKPRLGFWIMPDNQREGMLEDFCAEMAPPATLDYVRATVEAAKSAGHTRFAEAHRSKAVIHTYLAWQNEPGKPLGQSVTAHALQAESRLARRFADWLQRLFGA